MIRLFIALFLASLLGCTAAAEDTEHPRLLLSAEDVAKHANTWRDTPAFAQAVNGTARRLDDYFASLPDVPVPVDAGGGYTHEQHKRNGVSIYDAGLVYQWTKEPRYADYAKRLLLSYARLYPTLDEHPEKKEQSPGRLFWQSLNEAVWLVYAIQGYDAIYTTLDAATRQDIEKNLLRTMADFLSVESPQTFNKVHNHGTWATAAVGMTGYVIGDSDYVNTALLGLAEDGEAGFIRQLDALFSPDGYYTEGPYYQRYALMPFVLFAKSIDQNDPQRKIFEYRDGLLKKAIYSAIQQSYNGLFFPINDAIKDKGLDTVELDYAISIAYGLTNDPSLLSLLNERSSLVLSADGLTVAKAREAGLATPFDYRSMRLRDGADGEQGALTVLRSGRAPGHAAVLFKATSQGMGHGHFDRLNFLYYDNGHEVVADYGAARFLNVVQKNGGHYLKENKTWAKQTVAHNTLVVDQNSHFDGKLRRAEKTWPTAHYFDVGPDAQIVSAREATAYPGTEMTRTMLMLKVPSLSHPVIVDVMRVASDATHDYDLPLHYRGQIVDSNRPIDASTASLAPLGKDNGYQHLWLRGSSRVEADSVYAMTWLLGNRFYTYSSLSNRPSSALLVEVGANDPLFNLRHEPALITRLEGASDAVLVGVLEAHGEYNGAREYTTDSSGSLRALRRYTQATADLIELRFKDGQILRIGLSYDADATRQHQVRAGDQDYTWSGFYQVFDAVSQP